MTRRSALIAACLGILVAGSVHGQARNTTAGRKAQVRLDPVAQQAAKLKEIDSWLRRLVGQFRLSLLGTTLHGSADCSGIGTGPGVHCILSFDTPGQKDRTSTVMLFGVDTVDTELPRVHRFQLNGDSTAEMGVSRLSGDAVTFQMDCPVIEHYPPLVTMTGATTFSVLSCRRETRVQAGSEGRFVRIGQSTFEQVLVCGSWMNRGLCEIKKFSANVEWTLARVQTPRGISR